MRGEVCRLDARILVSRGSAHRNRLRWSYSEARRFTMLNAKTIKNESSREGESSCGTNIHSTKDAFERSSKRRRGFPSETHVKRGCRVVRGEKELVEKLGRNDPCPCG